MTPGRGAEAVLKIDGPAWGRETLMITVATVAHRTGFESSIDSPITSIKEPLTTPKQPADVSGVAEPTAIPPFRRYRSLGPRHCDQHQQVPYTAPLRQGPEERRPYDVTLRPRRSYQRHR